MSEERKIILSGFTFMKEEEPDDFEVCVIVEKNCHLSAGCWMDGVFRQGRGGVIDADNVLAWLTIEKISIDINSYSWNPAVQLIARLCGFNVWGLENEPIIILEYTGGDEPLVIHMDVATGEILEREADCKGLKYLKTTINDWYKTYSKELLDGYQEGKYYRLPDYE